MKKKVIAAIIAIAVIAVIGGGTYKVAHANEIKHQQEVKHEQAVKKEQKAKAVQAEKAKEEESQNVGHWAKNKYLGYINPYDSWFKPSEIAPGENLLKSAESYAVPANRVAKMIAGNDTSKQKEVFLTFDDGPSTDNTPKILNILKNAGVHATFFVIGDHLKSNPAIQQIVRKEIMDGDAVGDHTFTHVYSELYPGNSIDVPYFMNQVNETKSLLTDVLGPNFDTRIVRLPGGYMSRAFYHDPHLLQFNEALDKENLTALDWTTETGDSDTSASLDPQELLKTMDQDINQQPHPNQVVVLMHDAGAKKDTVTALPYVINYFKQHGYKFEVIENPTLESFKETPVKTMTYSNQGDATPTKETVTKDGKKVTETNYHNNTKNWQYN